MIPYPYNMVDMGGIDLAEANGIVVDGLYAKIVEAVNACGDVVLYNWKFADIEITPQHTTILLGDPIIINGAIQVTEQDMVTVPGINPVILPLSVNENGEYSADDFDADGFNPVEVSVPPPVIESLSVNLNGTYYIPEGVDGFNPVEVSVLPALSPISIDANGTYLPPQGVDGFSSVSVAVPGASPWPSQDVEDYINAIIPVYQGGYEYKGYIYNTQLATDCGLVLLADASQIADSVQLAEPITNFSGVVLQGVYNKGRTSQYNTTLLYLSPVLNTQYWAGMKDRNSSHTCYVTFTSDSEATLSGNKQVIIYGIP